MGGGGGGWGGGGRGWCGAELKVGGGWGGGRVGGGVGGRRVGVAWEKKKKTNKATNPNPFWCCPVGVCVCFCLFGLVGFVVVLVLTLCPRAFFFVLVCPRFTL